MDSTHTNLACRPDAPVTTSAARVPPSPHPLALAAGSARQVTTSAARVPPSPHLRSHSPRPGQLNSESLGRLVKIRGDELPHARPTLWGAKSVILRTTQAVARRTRPRKRRGHLAPAARPGSSAPSSIKPPPPSKSQRTSYVSIFDDSIAPDASHS